MSNGCNCMLCRHSRGEVSDDEYRNYILDSLRNNPNNDKVVPFSELEFDEDCMALYELETKGNDFSDENVWGTVQSLLKKYGILEDRTRKGGYNLDYLVKQRMGNNGFEDR